MDTDANVERRWQQAVALGRQRWLVDRITLLFQRTVDARAPKRRPPGKAGLKAEKEYYRLLYLEDVFQTTVNAVESSVNENSGLQWEHMHTLLRQLADLPELRSEIMAGIVSVLEELLGQPSAG